MKDFTVFLCIGASFDDRDQAYNLVEAFHQFLNEEVPVENFDLQDVKLGFRYYDERNIK